VEGIIIAVWGMRAIGRYVPAKITDEVVAGRIYESQFQTTVDIPDFLELPLLTALRSIRDAITGTETTYIKCEGTQVIVQWKSRTASPEVVSAEIKETIERLGAGGSPLLLEAVVVAFVAIAVGVAVYMVLTALYQIVSFLGAETTSMIFQMIFFMMVWVFLSALITPFIEMIRRRGE